MGKPLRERMMEIAKLIYDRHLSNVAGGNMSVRVDPGRMYITPSYNGKRELWRLYPDKILLADLEGNIIDGIGDLSREYVTHQAIYKAFPKVGAVIHAHPRNTLLFAGACREIPPYFDLMDKFGTIPVAPSDPPILTQGFSDNVVRILGERRETLETVGFGVLYPRHGVTVAAPTIEDAYDLLERIEDNCYALLLSRLLAPADASS